MIVAEKIHKHFGRVQALRGVSFSIGQGEIVGFLGQNGAGKSTLMRIIMGYYLANEGRVLVDGQDVTKERLLTRRKIGYLPETPPLYPELTVMEYLRYVARLRDIAPAKVSIHCDRAIETCQLKDVRHRLLSVLSKGYKQRVGLAQAILHDPQILILDEPTAGLDPLQNLHVRNLIKNLEHKRTVILSTHILTEIEQIARRVIILKGGAIVADSPLAVLLQSAPTLEAVFMNLHQEELSRQSG